MNLGDRTKYIGGSDISAVLGLNRWKTPLALFLEKTGEVEQPDLAEVEAVEWGLLLEDPVAKKFSRKNNVKVLRTSRDYVHPKYDYIIGHIDRLVAGTEDILEVKTCCAWKLKEWDGEEIPYEYIVQLQLYLGLTGRNVGHIACLIGGQKYIQKKIVFDPELYELMINKAVEFWEENVLKKIPPLAGIGDQESLLEMFPTNLTDKIIEANENFNIAIARRQELSAEIKASLKEKEEIENSFKQIIGNNIGLMTCKYKITWKPQDRKGVDSNKLKSDGIYDNYTKINKIRVLAIRLKKEKK